MTLFQLHVSCYVFVTVLCYSDDFLDGYHYHRAFPQEVMVDVINNFGLSLLEAHNEGNENNIALSPYGATSVLVVLGEGIRGYAIKEIQEATRIPLDISVIRVGLRDIHRHLKSYFIPKEGFLAGLTLSNEKVPLIPRYEEILRFYGYDLESFNNPLYPDESTSGVYMNFTTITMTMTTPATNQTTIQSSDFTTTEIPKTDSMESRFEITEMLQTEKPQTTTEQMTVLPISENTVIDVSNNAMINTTSTVSIPITTMSEEYTTTTPKLLSTEEATTLSSTSLTTKDQLSTTSNSLSPTEPKMTDSSGSNSNVEEIILTTSTESSTVLITTSEISETAPVLTTAEPKSDNIESLTNKENMDELLSMIASTTSRSDEFKQSFPMNVEATTSNSEQALEVSDMIRTDIFTKTTPPETTTLSTSDNDMKLSNMITTTSESLLTSSTLFGGGNSTDVNTDSIIVATTVESTSEMKQNDIALTTTSQQGIEMVTTSTSNLDTTTPTEENLIKSTILDNLIDSNSNLQEIVENITQNTPSTLESIEDETTLDPASSISTDVMVTNSVTQSFSRVTTTFETSSSVNTDIAQNNAISTQNNNIAFEVDSTTSMEVTSSDNIDAENNTETVDPLTTKTNDFTTETTMSTVDVETLTKVPENETTKREARSLIDYVIARYYDNIPSRDYYQRSYIPEEKLSFLVYGKVRETNINFMTYDAVLPIAYIPVIDALALSFPLDSKEYYLLLLLPIDETGINKLIYNIKRRTSLRNIINSLRYAHVKAIIPSFMLKGYVILTPTLQKLGIRRIFEPRHTDFSLMTKERDIYVTNVEQAVTVKIKNYVDPDNLPNYRNLQRYRPVEFKADHPFLYFVMDTEIHVNLMAGKIVNPLNSRIR